MQKDSIYPEKRSRAIKILEKFNILYHFSDEIFFLALTYMDYIFKSIYNNKNKNITRKNEEFSLENFKGKVMLIVNTATGCGFTPQYDALENMYEELKNQGFEVLDFPCNQFFHQAPGSDEEINAFCTLKFNTKFTRFKKIEVKGDKADPLYKWLITQNEDGKAKAIKWNFTKFLINRKGEVVARFAPTDKPESFIDQVKEELKK